MLIIVKGEETLFLPETAGFGLSIQLCEESYRFGRPDSYVLLLSSSIEEVKLCSPMPRALVRVLLRDVTMRLHSEKFANIDDRVKGIKDDADRAMKAAERAL